MTARATEIVLGLFMATMLLAAASAAEPPSLKYNPFSRPPSAVTFESRDTLDSSFVGPLVLTATMVSSGSRFANIGGRVIRPGDEIHGYTLLQVFEDRAVFIRDDKRVTVYVKPKMETDDD